MEKKLNKYLIFYLSILLGFSYFFLSIKYQVGNDSTISEWFINYVEGNIEPKGIHSSEYAWAKEEFDFVIDNNGTKEQLYEKIDALIVSNKITNTPAEPTGTTQPLAIGANSF